MESIKRFFIDLPHSWWGILLITLACCIVWLLLSVILYKPFFKRFYDLLFSVIGLPFFFLLFIPIAIAIKINDGGPVFYCGERLGKKGRIFKMLKFRSMKVNAPDIRLKDGSTYNSDRDERVTGVGRFLRKTSLDEIPQLFNILAGHMSFIGPRPDLPDAMEKYAEGEKRRLKLRPGVTGYNQAYFRNSIEWKKRIENDIYYVDKVSLFLDLKILFKTALSVLRRKNVNVSEQVLRSAGSEDSGNLSEEESVCEVREQESPAESEREFNSLNGGGEPQAAQESDEDAVNGESEQSEEKEAKTPVHND